MQAYLGRILAAAIAVLSVAMPLRAETLKVLIVDGQNNHNWQAMPPIHHKTLEVTRCFSVDPVTTPGHASKDGWGGWRPKFSQCDVILSNCNGSSWPEGVILPSFS